MCLDVICHPRLILIGAGSNGAASLLGQTFSASEWTPPLHSHFFACEMAWMPVRGVGLRTDWEGSQEKTAVPRVYTCTPPWTQDPPLPLPSQAFHIGQASLCFRAFECDSSSPPACDEPNSSGLPTHRVVSPSSLLILGLHCTQAEGLPVSDLERHTAKSTQL